MTERPTRRPTEATHVLVDLGLTAPGTVDLGSARERLLAAARAEELVDVAYRIVDSPVGPLLVCVTPAGVVRMAFDREYHDDVLTEVAGKVSPRVLADLKGTEAVARQLDEYFAGRRRRFELDVDLQLARGFRHQVLERLREVPYGATTSYAGLAMSAGSPRAVRAVGTACAVNPVPIVVPCHRVVRSDGTAGNYRGGPEAKLLLLDLERARA